MTQIVLAGGTQWHLHGVLASVCQDWRRCLLQNTRQLSVGLTSTSGAASLTCWLQAHGAALQQLHMATVGLFGRNCDPEARLRLFKALHTAAAGPGAPDDSGVPEPRPAGGAAGGSSSSTQDDSGSPGGSSSSSQHSGGGRSSSRQPSGGGSQGTQHEGGGLGGADSEAAGSSDSGADSSEEEGWTDSPARTPAVGGLFGGCSHLATPSPSGGLIAAAAAAAAAGATAVGVGAAVAGPLGEAQPTGFGYLHNEQPLQQQQQQPSQQGTPSKRSTPRKQLHQQQQHQLLVQPQQQQVQQQGPQQLQLQLQQLSANMRLTPADCAAIASLPAPQLCSLWLQGSRTRRLAVDGVRCLAGMTQLTSLKLQQFSIGDDATVLLAKSLTRLQLLFLSGNNIGPAGAAAVAQHCTRLEHLDLSINRWVSLLVQRSNAVLCCAVL